MCFDVAYLQLNFATKIFFIENENILEMNVYIRINSLAKKNHQNKRIMKEESDIIFNFPSHISEYFSIIVGIGGGASRVVNQMQKLCLPDVGLYAFGMNRKK